MTTSPDTHHAVPSPRRHPRIAVVGSGIGGLTLALALRQRGLEIQVFEQAPQLAEIGAAVALSANATRELRRLGVLDGVAAASIEPTELIYRDWRTARRVAAHPVHVNLAYQARFGAPYFGIHRADLQRVLSEALGGAGLHLGHRLSGIAERNGVVSLEFANGQSYEADIVIGGDGVRSPVRRYITGEDGVAYTGTSAFRGIVPTSGLPSLPDPHAIQFWMGPDAHLLHYAIGADGQDVNFFAVVEGPKEWPAAGSTQETGPGEAVDAFQGWHPAVIEMIASAPNKLRWGLFVVPHLIRWHRGRTVLMGDSAHAMVPHHGQGANTTIEDAITLAEILPGLAGADADTVEAAFRRDEGLRRARTRKIQRSSWATNGLLHLPDGPALPERDAKMARFPDAFGWIHEHDALQTARAAAQPVAA